MKIGNNYINKTVETPLKARMLQHTKPICHKLYSIANYYIIVAFKQMKNLNTPMITT